MKVHAFRTMQNNKDKDNGFNNSWYYSIKNLLASFISIKNGCDEIKLCCKDGFLILISDWLAKQQEASFAVELQE